MPGSEAFLREYHAAHAGVTSRAFARGGSYERLAARVADARRILDLGCGDGHLLSLLGPRAVGIDMSPEELALARGLPAVRGRAQELPFADGAFDAVVSHLVFMLLDEPARVVAEIDRVLAQRGAFHAVIGAGPTAEGRDAFHAFLEHNKPRGVALGDPRAKSEAGWNEMFAGWRIEFERWPIDLSGPFDEVYYHLSTTYQAQGDVRAELRAEFGAAHLPFTIVLYCATATR